MILGEDRWVGVGVENEERKHTHTNPRQTPPTPTPYSTIYPQDHRCLPVHELSRRSPIARSFSSFLFFILCVH